MKARIKEIARNTGVNISTVSRALSGKPGVSAEMALRIRQEANRLNYIRKPERKSIALILPESTVELRYYSLHLFNTLRFHGVKRGFRLEMICADQLELLDERMISGAVSFDFSSHLAKVIGGSRNLPLVCINDSARHIDGISSVFSNELQAVGTAVGHLTGYGHRKIGLIINGDPGSCCNRERAEAFEKMIRLYRLHPESRVIQGAGNPGGAGPVEELHGAMLELTAAGVTAVINTGESDGVNALGSLEYCGFRVPEDISLMSWEVPGVSGHLSPPQTTLGQDFDGLAQQALEMLEQAIGGRPAAKDALVDYILHRRRSIALPRVK